MRNKVLVWACVLALQAGARVALCQQAPEKKAIAVQAGDTLAVNSDFGRIRIRPGDSASVELAVQKVLPAPSSSVEVATHRSGSIIFVYSFFSGAPGEAAHLDIRAPNSLNVMVWGANPEVDIAGIHGTVRVQAVAGRILAEDLTGATSLVSDRGDVVYRARVQPRGDVRIESGSGSVYCELFPMLNLRSWLRAGGAISWEGEPPVRATSVEKQLGTLGPLLYAASVSGNVQIAFKSGLSPSTLSSNPTVPASNAPAVAGVAARAPEPAAEPRMQPRATEAPDVVREPQGPASQPVPTPGGGYALRVNVESVLLNVSVRDRSTNRSIAGLETDDFAVYEDGVQQQVAQLTPMEAPFDLLLLLDVSGSTAPYMELMKEAAIDFTRQLKANDRVALATFNSSVRLVEGFTNNRSAAERAIQRIRSGGGTAFYDALMESLDSYMRGLEGRSAIVVFTDGVDNQLDRSSSGSSTTFGELYRRVQESDTIIYTIFLDTEGQAARGTPTIIWPRRRGGIGFPPFPFPIPTPRPSRDQSAVYDEAREQLLQIAEQTGGRMYSPKRVEDLSRVYSEIADDLRIQYQLGYNSTNRAHDGRWRQIKVQVTSHPGAVVRTRKGYYARKTA